VRGEVEKEDGVLVIKRIHVRYRLVADAADEETARRSHEVHHSYCPVYRTIQGCVDITTELEIEAPA
jgi:uncharacterized OsmC-like protein